MGPLMHDNEMLGAETNERNRLQPEKQMGHRKASPKRRATPLPVAGPWARDLCKPCGYTVHFKVVRSRNTYWLRAELGLIYL